MTLGWDEIRRRWLALYNGGKQAAGKRVADREMAAEAAEGARERHAYELAAWWAGYRDGCEELDT